jgi:hypothetical protein
LGLELKKKIDAQVKRRHEPLFGFYDCYETPNPNVDIEKYIKIA